MDYPTLNLLRAMSYLLIHTGQHYDYEMPKIFFENLNLPEPDKIIKEAMKILKNGGKKGNCPTLWDGRAVERIIKRFLQNKLRKEAVR